MTIKMNSLQLFRRLTKKCSTKYVSTRTLSQYHSEVYNRELEKSIKNPEEYWGEISENTVWTKKWTKVLDNSRSPFVRWFVDGELSMCYNVVDRHVDEGHGDQTALIWDSPITG